LKRRDDGSAAWDGPPASNNVLNAQSITGSLAHDVYGRILKPDSSPEQRMRMFKVFAIVCGGAAILLGLLVEKFEINKLVGWAFAIAATSYFPLLFLATWWRGTTMRGAATGMLVGGTCSLSAIISTMIADSGANALRDWKSANPGGGIPPEFFGLELSNWFAQHPLLRTLAEQPAIWGLPLALALMVVNSKANAAAIPADARRKMLVLHAPEALGLKEEYIKEHDGAGH
jgi:Na+(H+)/acetate symporter ActP